MFTIFSTYLIFLSSLYLNNKNCTEREGMKFIYSNINVVSMYDLVFTTVETSLHHCTTMSMTRMKFPEHQRGTQSRIIIQFRKRYMLNLEKRETPFRIIPQPFSDSWDTEGKKNDLIRKKKKNENGIIIKLGSCLYFYLNNISTFL